MKNFNKSGLIMLLIFFLGFTPVSFSAEKKSDNLSFIYVPVYSSIFHGNQDRVINLAVTLSIRNVDSSNNITVHSIDYYNSSGELIRNYLKYGKNFNTISDYEYYS